MSVDFGKALSDAVREARAPGAVAYVGDLERTYLHAAAGLRQRTPASLPAGQDTVYDLASLTKVLATATAVMQLRDAGLLDLEQPVSELLPVPEFSAFTVRHLLTHTSGLPPTRPYFRDVTTVNEVVARAAEEALEPRPGTRRRYSDIGYILLGAIVELTAKEPFDVYCARAIWTPLGMHDTAFNPGEALAARTAATEQCRWRNRVVIGKVHDENAYAVGGVAGHAGLFSTAADLARFSRGLFAGRVLKESTLREMAAPTHVPTYPWQGLGWKRNPWAGASEGHLPARNAIGHTGWTGTCIWIDLDTGRFLILLSNTCHPSRDRRNNRALRQSFSTPVAKALYPDRANVHTGVDRLMWEGLHRHAGARIGLLTNHAATDHLGRHILEVFRLDPAVRLRRLFSPEHGLDGQAEAGERVGAQQAPVPVVSLYGERRRPLRSELDDLDLFLIDLQDIGSRYYTYMSSMRECLIACAAAGVPVQVLDRPNPIGGTILEGALPERVGSFVCSARVPVRHGMTMGELAEHFRRTEPELRGLQLSVAELDGWRRDLHHDGTALPWRPPSPNIPNPDTALLYVGMCLFEGTNLNEGRGTMTPFKLVGAPWLDAPAILRAMPASALTGLEAAPMQYTPVSIPGKATSPRFQNHLCRGIRVEVADRHAARPFTFAVAFIRAALERHPDRFEITSFFDTLAGGSALRSQLAQGMSAAEIAEAARDELAEFDRNRPKRYT